MLEYTNTTYAPWHVIASTDRLHAELEIYHTVIDGIKTALALKQHRKEHPITTNIILPGNFTFVPMPKLKDVSLDKTITDEKYKKQLKKLQEELSELHNKIYRKRVPVVVCYEGWTPPARAATSAVWPPRSTPADTRSSRLQARPRRSSPTTICGGSGRACQRMGISQSSTAPGMAV